VAEDSIPYWEKTRTRGSFWCVGFLVCWCGEEEVLLEGVGWFGRVVSSEKLRSSQLVYSVARRKEKGG